MKPVSRMLFDQALLRRRSPIETVFDELKNLCQVDNTRHRLYGGFLVNLMAGIIAYYLTLAHLIHCACLPLNNLKPSTG